MPINTNYYRILPIQIDLTGSFATVASTGGDCLRQLFKTHAATHALDQHGVRMVIGAVILLTVATNCLVSAVMAAVQHFRFSPAERKFLIATLDGDLNTLKATDASNLRQTVHALAALFPPVVPQKEIIQEVSISIPEPKEADWAPEDFNFPESKNQAPKPSAPAYSDADWYSAVSEVHSCRKDADIDPEDRLITFRSKIYHLQLKEPTAETVQKAIKHIENIRLSPLQPIYCPMSIRPQPLPPLYYETDDWECGRITKDGYTMEIPDLNSYQTNDPVHLPFKEVRINPNELKKVKFQPKPPLPSPDKNTRLSWLLNAWDKHGIVDQPPISAIRPAIYTRANLKRYVDELNNQSCAHLPKGHEAYARMKTQALLSVEAMQKLPDHKMLKRLRQVTALGPLCGPGKKDGTAELYEVLTSDFSLELDTPGTVGEILTRALEASMKGAISNMLNYVPEKIRHETGIVSGYICSQLANRGFPIPPSIEYASNLAIGYNYAWQAFNADYNLQNKKVSFDLYIVSRALQFMLEVFPETFTDMINRQVQKTPELATQIIEILKDYAVDLDSETKMKRATYLDAKNAATEGDLQRYEQLNINPVIQDYKRLKARLKRLEQIVPQEDSHQNMIRSLIAVTRSDLNRLTSIPIWQEWVKLDSFMACRREIMDSLEEWYLSYEKEKSNIWTKINTQYSLLLNTGEDYTGTLVTRQGAIALAVQLGILTQTT